MREDKSGRLQREGKPFQPLPKVILVDDFAENRSGWYLMYENGEGYELDWGTVTRSTMPTHWFGSHGAQSGHYSLKTGTVPEAGKTTRAIKRVTMPYYDGNWYSTLRMEAVFAYHEEPRGTHTHTKTPPEKPELTGESAVRGFAFEFDLHDRDHRWMPGVRYLNYEREEKHAKWQYRPKGIDALWKEFKDVPDGTQALCWNSPNDSIPWKANWHYVRIDLDLGNHQYDELQVNDFTFDLSALHSEAADEVYEPDMMTSPWPHIDGLLNPMLTIQTNKDTRSFLYVDSYALSAEV